MFAIANVVPLTIYEVARAKIHLEFSSECPNGDSGPLVSCELLATNRQMSNLQRSPALQGSQVEEEASHSSQQ